MTILWEMSLSKGGSRLRGWLGKGCILVAKVSKAIATITEFLEPSLWAVDVCLEKKGRFWGKTGAGICLVEAPR